MTLEMRFKIISGLALIAIISTIILASNNYNLKNKIYEIESVEKVEVETEDKLGKFALTVMTIINAQLSPIQKQLLARNIVQVANDLFEQYAHKEAYVVMIAVESKFNRNAKSPAGAIGLTQVMPQYANEFAAHCSIEDKISADDLQNIDLNLLIGGCQFRYLLEELNSVNLALVAYNAGINSQSLGQLKNIENVTNIETVNYIAKHAFIKEKARDEVKGNE